MDKLIGKYFVAEWGYDQTNISFFKVLRASKKTVCVVPCETVRKHIDSGEYLAMPGCPNPDRWMIISGDETYPARKLIQSDSRGLYVITYVGKARLWDGSPRHGTDC